MPSINIAFTYCLLAGFCTTWILGQEPSVTIRAIPGRVIKTGQSVTLRCEADREGVQICFLVVESQPIHCEDVRGKVANYTINNLKYSYGGKYYCSCKDPHISYRHRCSSQTLTLEILDLQKPKIYWERNPADNPNININCVAPNQTWEYKVRFTLFKNTVKLKETDSQRDSLSGTFSVPHDGGSEYRCSYGLIIQEDPTYHLESPLSDSVNPGDSVLPDADNAFPGSMIAIVSSTAVVVLLAGIVLIACVIRRKREISKNNANDNALPLDDKSADVNENVYCSAEENMSKSDSNINQGVQKSDGNRDDGVITYAVLNQNALQTKKSSKNIQEEASVYAQVKTGNDK